MSRDQLLLYPYVKLPGSLLAVHRYNSSNGIVRSSASFQPAAMWIARWRWQRSQFCLWTVSVGRGDPHGLDRMATTLAVSEDPAPWPYRGILFGAGCAPAVILALVRE